MKASRWIMKFRRLVALVVIAVVAIACNKDSDYSTETTTIQLYIEELKPCEMTSCNYAQPIDSESNVLRLKLWLGRNGESGYEYRSMEVFSATPVINVDDIPLNGEYTLYGWADYVQPNGGNSHFNPLEYPSVEQVDFALNDESYGGYIIVARIKNGKLVDSDGKMQRATTKYRIVTEDEELAARVATIELREKGGYTTAGINISSAKSILYKNVNLNDNKAMYPDEPRCLATVYTMFDCRSRELAIDRNLIITLKDANGEEIVTYKNIAALIDNDMLTTIVLPSPDRYLDSGEYTLSAYNEVYMY